MNDLISRQELIDMCDDVIECGIPNELGLHPIAVEAVKYVVENMPSIDVVENKALRLLLDWVIECDFGYDFIPEEYEKYKDDIQDMSYSEGLIYIAMKEVEDEQMH